MCHVQKIAACLEVLTQADARRDSLSSAKHGAEGGEGGKGGGQVIGAPEAKLDEQHLHLQHALSA